MKTSSIIDYCSCILFRFFGLFIRFFPVSFSLFLGRRLGDLVYCFDFKRRVIVYANLRTAFSAKLSPLKTRKITKAFYRNLGQNFIEIFLIPCIDKNYINKYVAFQGLEYLQEAFKKGKGAILLGVHAGSWELSNIIFANMGFVFNLLVRDQSMPYLNALLDSYRAQKGCKLIRKANQTRELIEALKGNEAVGMTVDQGGRAGVQVNFLGKPASMAAGAIKLALKYDCIILPGYYTRIKGPYIKTIMSKPFEVSRTGNLEIDIRNNLERLIPVFECYIKEYPQDYFWRYKVWKYSQQVNILLLDDRKAGHLRQAQGALKIIGSYLKGHGVGIQIHNVEVENKFSASWLTLSACLAGKYNCQGCLLCLRKLLRRDSYEALTRIKPDIIISCGSSLAAVNFILSRQNLAASVAIMKPSIFSTRRFSLVIMPEHDKPPRRKNIAITQGALNIIDEDYLKGQVGLFRKELLNQGIGVSDSCIGVFLGGDTKSFRLDENLLSKVIRQIKKISEDLNLDILVSTSRRTSKVAEGLLRRELGGCARCKFLVIANEKNYPFVVGGILGLSKFVVVSPESISMISEAVSSRRYTIVFNALGLKKKHRDFLLSFARHKYIYLVEPGDISAKIADIYNKKPEINLPRNEVIIKESLSKIL